VTNLDFNVRYFVSPEDDKRHEIERV